ncbi:hypothetical protein N657DRAFT_657210 [Parathielavia appendiculata]|uniref:Protein kinase domain-containing protein n=1 Tax=Parathielavia appendiculata TaxID=2587402 RepID=A0AAN6TX36_9PEZI|nr:hypothetical protein N657DRAFT_657210 [Parathielavia appendiculata]
MSCKESANAWGSVDDTNLKKDEPHDYITFYTVTPVEEVYFGQSSKKNREMTLAQYQAALERVEDAKIYPACPAGIDLTIAPENLDHSCAYIERPGLCTNSKMPHPDIVNYHGCRVRRGRITAIVLEQLNCTPTQYASAPAFQTLDKVRFFEALESAVYYLHSLGPAHNDIDPDNIMVMDGIPVLIDFGSLAAYGERERLQSLGTPNKHDAVSLGKLQRRLQDPR